MSKEFLVNRVQAILGGTKIEAAKAVDAVADAIEQTVMGGAEFRLAPLGTFRRKDSPARKGRNPATGDPIDIAASSKIVFKQTAKKG